MKKTACRCGRFGAEPLLSSSSFFAFSSLVTFVTSCSYSCFSLPVFFCGVLYYTAFCSAERGWGKAICLNALPTSKWFFCSSVRRNARSRSRYGKRRAGAQAQAPIYSARPMGAGKTNPDTNQSNSRRLPDSLTRLLLLV